MIFKLDKPEADAGAGAVLHTSLNAGINFTSVTDYCACQLIC